MKEFDYIILGGGCAGLSLAYQLDINNKLKVTMIHGEKDESVPPIYSKKVLKIFKKAEKKLVIIKKGDHSLSSKNWLRIIIKELSFVVNSLL